MHDEQSIKRVTVDDEPEDGYATDEVKHFRPGKPHGYREASPEYNAVATKTTKPSRSRSSPCNHYAT
jgi:hypothetical protein